MRPADGTASASAGTEGGGAFGSASWLGRMPGDVSNSAAGSGSSSFEFKITPRTLVRLTTKFVGQVTTTAGIDGDSFEPASASSALSVVLHDVGKRDYHEEYHSASWIVATIPSSGGDRERFDNILGPSFANTSDTSVIGSFQASTQAYAGLVPEPGTYGLLLAGLIGVGVAVRHAAPRRTARDRAAVPWRRKRH